MGWGVIGHTVEYTTDIRYLLRHILHRDPTASSTHYALTELGDETRHMVMYGKAIERVGARPVRPRRYQRWMINALPLAFRGAFMWVAALIGEADPEAAFTRLEQLNAEMQLLEDALTARANHRPAKPFTEAEARVVTDRLAGELAELEALSPGSANLILKAATTALSQPGTNKADRRRTARRFERMFAVLRKQPVGAARDAREFGLLMRWHQTQALWHLQDGLSLGETADAMNASVTTVLDYLAAETCSDEDFFAEILADSEEEA